MKPKAALGALLLGLLPVLAAASPVLFVTTLSGPGESPPNASAGTGTAQVLFDMDAHTMLISAVFSGLTGTTTASHIHCCTALPGTATAGIATEVPTFSLFPLGVTAGSFSELYDLSLDATFNPPFLSAHGGTAAGAAQALFDGLMAGTAYLNIHTTEVRTGEIRGFLQVPEPAGLALASLGLLAAATMRRRR